MRVCTKIPAYTTMPLRNIATVCVAMLSGGGKSGPNTACVHRNACVHHSVCLHHSSRAHRSACVRRNACVHHNACVHDDDDDGDDDDGDDENDDDDDATWSRGALRIVKSNMRRLFEVYRVLIDNPIDSLICFSLLGPEASGRARNQIREGCSKFKIL